MTLKDTVDTEDPKTSISKDEMIGHFPRIQQTSSLPISVNGYPGNKADIIILRQHYSEKNHDNIALVFAMPSVLTYDFQKMWMYCMQTRNRK